MKRAGTRNIFFFFLVQQPDALEVGLNTAPNCGEVSSKIIYFLLYLQCDQLVVLLQQSKQREKLEVSH